MALTPGMLAVAAAMAVSALILESGVARADKVTECTTDAFCYCINSEPRGAIEQNVTYIRG